MRKKETHKALLVLGVVVLLFGALMGYQAFSDRFSGSKNMQVSSKNYDDYQTVTGVLSLQSWKNKYGAKVLYVHAASLPFVDIQVVFDAGSARNHEGHPVAYFANYLLNQGTSNYDEDSIADQFERVGAIYDAEAQRDLAYVSLRSLTDQKYLKKALKLFSEVLARPSYSAKVLKREQENAISQLKYQAQTPRLVAQRAFFEAIYGQASYGIWPLGDEKTVKKIKPKDLISFHKTFYVQKNATILIVGDVSLQDANAISEQVIAALPAGEKAEKLKPINAAKKGSKKHIEFDSTQTHIIYGMPVLKFQDKDYFSLIVGNHILGGNSQTNRLFDTIRGQHGLAYSVYSQFSPMKEKGPFLMVCQTQAKEATKANRLIQDMLSAFIAKGPTEEEVAEAKLNLVGSYPLRLDSNQNIIQQITKIGFYDLPLGYFNDYADNIQAVTSASIQDAFKRHVHPDKMVNITVGASK